MLTLTRHIKRPGVLQSATKNCRKLTINARKMKLQLLILISILVFATAEFDCGRTFRARRRRIVGGSASQSGQWPWLVAVLQNDGPSECVGALITNQHVLTAANCFHRDSDESSYRVRLGDIHLKRDEAAKRELNVEKIYTQDYSPKTLVNDLSVIKLSEKVTFTEDIQPICLPKTRASSLEGKMAIVAGWGQTSENGEKSDSLMEIEIPIWKREECSLPKNMSVPNVICAGLPEGGKDACQGDSGAPLMYKESDRWTVVGITSFGIGCARPQNPGFYTLVSAYEEWIRDKISA